MDISAVLVKQADVENQIVNKIDGSEGEREARVSGKGLESVLK